MYAWNCCLPVQGSMRICLCTCLRAVAGCVLTLNLLCPCCALHAGMVVGVRPESYVDSVNGISGLPQVPGVLPGQDLEGGSECDYDLSERGSGTLVSALTRTQTHTQTQTHMYLHMCFHTFYTARLLSPDCMSWSDEHSYHSGTRSYPDLEPCLRLRSRLRYNHALCGYMGTCLHVCAHSAACVATPNTFLCVCVCVYGCVYVCMCVCVYTGARRLPAAR